MSGPVAIVTGASSGLGYAMAKLFLEKGVSVLGIARRSDGLRRFTTALGPLGAIDALQLDITADDAPSQAIARVLDRFGRLDYLVNNAGMGNSRPVHETSDEILDSFISVHLRAPFRFSREALRVMSPGGSIVHIASTYALVGAPRGGAYSACKAGLVGLARTMAAAYGPSGIRTNVVAPGVIPTPISIPRMEDPRFKRLMIETVPSDVSPTPEDVAEAVTYLCLPSGRFINGQVLVVDGGWSSTRYMPEEALTARRVMD